MYRKILCCLYDKKDDIDFKEHNIDNTKQFHISGTKKARIVNILDGDTITIILKLCDNYYKFNMRLYGIDTPELKSNDKKLRDISLRAKNRLYELITNEKLYEKNIRKQLNNNIYIKTIKFIEKNDKYGRLLGEIYTDQNISMCDILINEKLVYKYDGKKKLTEQEQIIYLKT